jgi:hypothetical protein
MGLAFGYFNGFWWFFCFKNSGFVFNERVGLYFYDKRVASPFSSHLIMSLLNPKIEDYGDSVTLEDIGYPSSMLYDNSIVSTGFVFNERVESYFYDKRIASHFFHYRIENKAKDCYFKAGLL